MEGCASILVAHGKGRFAGRTTEVANGPVLTWLFEGVDGGTRVTLVVLEEDLGWFQTLLEIPAGRWQWRCWCPARYRTPPGGWTARTWSRAATTGPAPPDHAGAS
jgi:hypothetical protein